MLVGVFKITKSGLTTISPTTVITIPAMAVSVMQLPIVIDKASRFLAPKYWDTMMLAPTLIPINKTISRLIIGPALPTAARALSPT